MKAGLGAGAGGARVGRTAAGALVAAIAAIGVATIGLAATGCGSALEAAGRGGAGSGAAPIAAAGSSSAAAAAEGPGLVFVEDDLPAATARAKAEGKALFVDAWAPWCHTCLSMKHYVFNDPSLRALSERVVFASIDTDRPSSASFLERHQVRVWPMFFVIDPGTDRVVGAWPGSASLAEVRSFVEDSLATLDGMRAGTLAEGDPTRLAVEARAAQAAGNAKGAAELFERAASKLPVGHARRSDVLAGWLFALYVAKDWQACVSTGERHLGEVSGAAVPADFASMLLACADHVEGAAKERARAAAIGRLRAFTASPPADASADDRADAWGILAEALGEAGDAAGARRAFEAKLAILERAAIEAKAPEVAATFDYARAMTYVQLGKGGLAIAMLEARERDMPGSYEPPARLASVLFKVGRYADAKVAVDRAIAKAYGPRRLGYLKLRGQIVAKLGDRAAAIATLRDEVRGYEELPAGQASPAALADAKKRLAEAESETGKP